MLMQEKILSVIIPMYNAQESIQNCLESVLVDERYMQCMEVLIINDGSTDRSESLVKEYTKRYPHYFYLISQKNGGHGSAINCGVKLCHGMFFKVLDADDCVIKKNLEKMIEILRALRNVDLVLTGYDICNSKKNTVESVLPLNRSVKECYYYAGMESILKKWWLYKRLFAFHGLMYRTEFYQKLGYILPQKVSYDDAFFSAVPASHAEKICVVNLTVYVYRIGTETQSTSGMNRVKKRKDLEQVLLKICRCRKEKSGLTKAGQEYLYRRLESYTADYFVTVFLRFSNRREGRAVARYFLETIRCTDICLYHRIKKKYLLLYVMNRLYMGERQFELLLALRKKLCGRHGVIK